MVPPAVVAWAAAAWLVTSSSGPALGIGLGGVATAGILLQWRPPAALPLTLIAVCLAAVATSCAWRLVTVEHSPLTRLADERSRVTLDLQIRRDARTFIHHGKSSAVVEVVVRRAVSRDVDVRVRDRATAFVEGTGRELVVGRRLVVTGRLAPSSSSDEAAVIDVDRIGPIDRAPWWWEASERVRAGVRRSVAFMGDEPRALVPALVDGDVGGISDVVEEDFRHSGLTHLMAVSGTNLTIVLAVVMVLGRAAGIRRRGLWVLGALSIVAFVLLARPDPSVVRAAAMGAVGVAALGFGTRGGVRALAWAIIGLVFVDPWLARSVGFILSVTATGGILVLAPVLAGRLVRWMPRWCALAVSVPIAAQLVCTPVIAAISGQISLVAVVANLFAAPAVAPATIAGLLGGCFALLSGPLSQAPGLVAGACASWILTVGHQAADLEAATVSWHAPWAWLLVLVPVAALVSVVVASRPVWFVGLSLGLLVAVWRPPSVGWPPAGWLMVACDVGQGDATVLDTGDNTAIVIDAGPEPAVIDRCLDRLHVRQVRLMVFTHAHADHVDGWPGVQDGRRVDQIAVGTTGGPRSENIPRHVVVPGESFRVGAVTARVLWPQPTTAGSAARVARAGGSAVNDESVVLAVRVRGVRLLLTGDIEPKAQEAILRRRSDVTADVVKIPHHGSARQSTAFFEAVGATIGTISAGEGNDYGHPAAAALSMLRREGIRWWRTDTGGDIAIVQREGRTRVVSRH